MKYELQFANPEKYPIQRFLDGLTEEYTSHGISVIFLDHRNNSAIIYADGEFGQILAERFKNNKSLTLKLPDKYHNPFHHTFELNGYLQCGCGWKESEQERIKRTIVITQESEQEAETELEFRIV